MKNYDRAYFDRWYRGPGRVHESGELRRKVAMAVAVAEYFIRRPLATVLDIGCGEGAWYPHLRRVRPAVAYTGLDSSDYAVERFGKARNIRKASFADLPRIRFRNGFDLVVCSDVLHYVRDDELRQGLPHLVRLTGGIAYIEVLTREDDIMGDLEGIVRRSATRYRRLFLRAALTPVGPYCWLSPALRDEAAALESQGLGVRG